MALLRGSHECDYQASIATGSYTVPDRIPFGAPGVKGSGSTAGESSLETVLTSEYRAEKDVGARMAKD